MGVSCKKNSAASRRILFASYHGYIDPSSGAAISVRELLTQLSSARWEVRTYCGPLLDVAQREDVRQLLADEQLSYRETEHTAGGCRFSLLTFRDGNVLSSLFVPTGPLEGHSELAAAQVFVDGFCCAIAQWRPDVLLTYGGNPSAAPMFGEARRLGVPIVFWLHNFAYRDARLFKSVDQVIVPSHCSADHYRNTLGFDSVVLPCPLDWDRVVCPRSSGRRYVTFVNPQPHKGVFVFARIAEQLHCRRPDIPLLIIEGRAGAEWLQRMELDLSGLTNLNLMKNTPDARDFYRASHLVLMPSLWRESFGRVAAEAMMNGIPVLASKRGALPEVVGDAGLLFDIPARYTPETREVPRAEEVTPWIDAIIRLWDDGELYDTASRRCRERAEAWRPEVLLPRYKEVLGAR